MKKLIIFLTVVVFSNLLFGQYTFEEKLFVPWGKSDSTLSFRKAPGGQYGPTSFQIKDKEVIILDAQNQTIKIYKDKKFKRAVKIPFYNADDFLWNSEKDYYVLNENKFYKMNKKTVINNYKTSSGRIRISKITKYENGQIALTTNILTTLKINSLQKGNALKKIDGIPDGLSGQIKAIRKNSQTAEVELADNSYYNININDLGAIKYIGATPEGFKYFLIEQITQQVPLKVARYIYLMNDAGKLKAKFNLPNIKFSYIFKEFSVDKKGNLYQMISAEDGIHIIEWRYENKFPKKVPIIKYPENLDQSYHYNDFEYPAYESNPLLKKKNNITASVTRAEALSTANSYIVCEWTGSSSNSTDGLEIINGDSVRTPSSNNGYWWTIGSNEKLTYKWGGFTSLSTFESGISSGKKAGDNYLGNRREGTVSWGDTYVIGVDCSGYVCRCWDTSIKYGTITISNVSFELGSFDDLEPADALNYASRHIRLFVDRNPDGTLLIAESAGSGWACRYHSFLIGDLSDYVPIRYDNISGSTGLISVVNPTSSIPIIVGKYDNPINFISEVKVFDSAGEEISDLNIDNFDIKIGGVDAEVTWVNYCSNWPDEGYYKLGISPPVQPFNGSYDFCVTISKDNFETTEVEEDAVIYQGESNNIDVVQVIDRSGSMGDGFYEPDIYYLQTAKNAGKLFVDQMEIGDMIGISSFSTSASVDYNLAEIISGENQQQLAKDAIDVLSADGSTTIGGGLQTGKNQLDQYGNASHPWGMILLSDGEENDPPYVDDVLPDIVTTKTKVYTISFGLYSDESLLDSIATETGGQYFNLPNPTSLDMLNVYNSIKGSIGNLQTFNVWVDQVQVGEIVTESVQLESGVENAKFTITWEDISDELYFELLNPGQDGITGTIDDITIDPGYASSNPDIANLIVGSTYKFYSIPAPNSGEWILTVSNNLIV